MIFNLGLDVESKANASGTARRITGSPYCNCKRNNKNSFEVERQDPHLSHIKHELKLDEDDRLEQGDLS